MKPAVMMIVSNKAKAFGILDWSALSSGQVIMNDETSEDDGFDHGPRKLAGGENDKGQHDRGRTLDNLSFFHVVLKFICSNLARPVGAAEFNCRGRHC